MQECTGKFFSQNGKLTDTQNFDSSFLSSPHYIYEAFRVIDGVALFLEDHLGRLEETCRLSKKCHGFSLEEVYRQVYKVIEANNFSFGNMKIVLYHVPEKGNLFKIYITEHQYPTEEQYLNGVAVALFKGVRHNPNAKIMDVKLRNATNLMKEQRDVYETLLVDNDGCITEGSRSNVFFIRNDEVITAPLQDVLPGITRKHIFEVCNNLKIPLKEKKIPARSVVVMEAAFITGTSRKVLPVNRIDELVFDASHPITQKIQKGFHERVNAYILSHKKYSEH